MTHYIFWDKEDSNYRRNGFFEIREYELQIYSNLKEFNEHPIAREVSFNLSLQSVSSWSLFNGTW